jgi:two-component system chemotaxis sensor kinase CheA
VSSLLDDELIDEFVAESREHLRAIEPDLLTMEKGGKDLSAEVINRVFRAIHSIKGAAGFLALDSMKDLSHTMESVLMRVRDGKLSVTGELMDPLFAGVDCLKLMVEDIDGSGGIPIEDQLRRLNAILEGGGAAPATVQGTAKQEVFNLDAEAVQSALGRGLALFHVSAFLHQDIHRKWSSPLAFLTKALLVGERLDAFLNVSDIGGLEQCLSQDVAVTLLYATPLDAGLVSRELQIPLERVTRLETPAIAAPPEPAASAPVKPAPVAPASPVAPVSSATVAEPKPEVAAPPSTAGRAAREAPAETLRIRVELLTHLMNLAGELVLGRNQLMRALARQATDSGLGAILQNINQVTTELQEGIMQTRMQPADTVFNRFPRIIRDMSKQLGKQIELEIRGSEVEIDKSLVELLADPLTHIIRNSVDHAIETPEERRQAGKDPTGHVLIRAWHQGGHVNIAIEDDGRGIDAARLLRKALAKGLLTEARAAQMTERETVNLIFAPGLSTRETVSETSGRGVGMDVVRSNTERMGGTVEVETALGKGTAILLRLPLTLAIIPSMIVGVRDQRFAIPQSNVVEFVAVRAADIAGRIERVHGAEVLRLRDRLLPLVHLAVVLGIDGAGGEPGDYNVVVLRAGSNLFGVVVDELFDIEEIVVKPLSEYAQSCKSLSGTTILGDGRVVLILDVGGLATAAGLRFADLKAEEKRRLELEKRRADVAALRRRAVVLCEGAGGEYFAIPQDSIQRLEKVARSSIQRAGEREYVNYGGRALPLIRLNDYLEVRAVAADAEEVFLVIPKYTEQGRIVAARAGIVISNIIDALDVDVELEPTRVKGPGILGSAILQHKLTLFLQPVEILRTAGLLEDDRP